MTPDFSRTRDVFQAGVVEGLHLGAQLHVAQAGRVLIDEAFGQAREGVPMTTDSIVPWLSAGKPLTALAIGQLVEQGRLDWETPVAGVIPEFAVHGKEGLTLRHLLTHTAGLRPGDQLEPALSWEERTARLCALPLELNWVPGQRAGYHTAGTWHLLGEIIQRLTGQELDAYVRERILRPLGLKATALAFRADELAAWEPRLAHLHDTNEAVARLKTDGHTAATLTSCRPGGSARGPVRELGRLYAALLNGGEGILRPETLATIIARQRAGLFDETFQYRTDCGFGFILNSNRDGFQMPYGYGRAASAETFGHSGHQCTCAFADPRHRLVVAWACTGQPGERRHQQRQRAVNNALYEDLGLAGA